MIVNSLDQYLAIEPKRVPDRGPVEAHMYHLPHGEWIAAQRSELHPGTWTVVNYLPAGMPVCLARGLDEDAARDVAHAARTARVAELAVLEAE